MGKDDIMNELIAINKKIGALDTKLDRVIKRQVILEKKIAEFEALEKSINTLPVKLNTTAYQIVSQFKTELEDITDEFEEKVSESIGKLESLANVNRRLDSFEELLKAHIERIRYMLMELEDSVREMQKEGDE